MSTLVDKSREPAAEARPGGARGDSLDVDVAGVVGVRIVDATPAEAARVCRQLGGGAGTRLEGPPDIVVRFVDRIDARTPVRWLGLDDAAFTDDAFLVLRGRRKQRVRVAVPLAAGGARCEITCERGAASVPLLIQLVNLTAVAHGALPLHASAFVYRGAGIVVTGWTKGGKTEALLAFMQNGAEYVGDEWVYVTEDGGRVAGIQEPIRLWRWHLEQLPAYAALLGRSERTRLRLLGSLASVDDRLRDSRRRPQLLDRTFALARKQLHADVEPERLFGGRRAASASFDRLFFVIGRDAPETTVEPADAVEVARRMVFSLQHERRELVDAYMKFRFAFPDAQNPLLDDVAELERHLAVRAFTGKEAFVVHHPYPLSLSALFDAMEPYAR